MTYTSYDTDPMSTDLEPVGRLLWSINSHDLPPHLIFRTFQLLFQPDSHPVHPPAVQWQGKAELGFRSTSVHFKRTDVGVRRGPAWAATNAQVQSVVVGQLAKTIRSSTRLMLASWTLDLTCPWTPLLHFALRAGVSAFLASLCSSGVRSTKDQQNCMAKCHA